MVIGMMKVYYYNIQYTVCPIQWCMQDSFKGGGGGWNPTLLFPCQACKRSLSGVGGGGRTLFFFLPQNFWVNFPDSESYEIVLSWYMHKNSVADDTTVSRSVDLWVNHARLRRGWSSPLWSTGVNVLCDSEEWLFNPESNGILVVDSCIAMFYLIGNSQSACTFNRNV